MTEADSKVENQPHICIRRRLCGRVGLLWEGEFLIVVFSLMIFPQFPEETRVIRKLNRATGPGPTLSREHRKQETTPNSLPDWLEETTKELCFFLHGNKLIETRWTKKERKLNR